MSGSRISEYEKGRAWTVFLLYCGLITFLSHQPGDPNVVPPFPHYDKVQHFGEYLVFAVFCLRAFFTVSTNRRKVLSAAAAFTLVFAVVDEWHQSFIPHRDGSLLDVITDLFGAAAGAYVYLAVRKMMYPGEHRSSAGGSTPE